jgi:hypothetical protein
MLKVSYLIIFINNIYYINLLSETPLSKFQLKIAIGLMMGDGFIKNGNLVLDQNVGHDFYFAFITNIFCNLNIRTAKYNANGKKTLTFSMIIINSIFDEWQHIWYTNSKGSKILPREAFMKSFDIRSFISWIADDGTRQGNKLNLCSYGLNKEDNEFICHYFKEKFKIEASVQKKDNKYYTLVIESKRF